MNSLAQGLKMLSLLLMGLRSVFASAQASGDEDGVQVEDEVPRMPEFPGGKMLTTEELLGMLDSMNGLSDEDRETLRRDLLKKVEGGAADADLAGESATSHILSSLFASQFFVLLAMLTLIALIFVFFGYKLYKSLSERERKREEKKKNKQMKKKK